jgi:hypothetical protein
MVVQELPVGLHAEILIERSAKDKPVPGLVHGMGRHSDDLVVMQRRRTTAQPLPQAGIDEFLGLPWAGFEDR